MFFGVHAIAPPAGALGPLGALAMLLTLAALAREGMGWLGFALLLAAPVALGLLWSGEAAGAIGGSEYHAPLFVAAAWVAGVRVVQADRADEDAVVGSICVYLLASLAFAALYAALAHWEPSAFSFGSPPPKDALFGEFLYFSLVTITTLGYGDVTAVHPLAQGLTCLEAVFGVLYPAIVVSRIVALASGSGTRPFAAPSALSDERKLGFPVLAGLLLLTLVLLPGADRSEWASWGFQLLITIQILAALYAVPRGRWTTGIAWALALATLLGGWGSELFGDSLAVLGRLGRTTFFVLASVVLLRWLLRETRVTRDVLYAAIAVYLMIGFSLAGAFDLLDSLVPGSIAFPESVQPTAASYVYLAFITLTTTGFGDVLPVAPAAEHLASLATVIGVFYPVALVARLVALYRS